ncbi:MAG: hypothetical protein AAF765_13830, partial [Bacteroidota bacterium]
MFPRKTRHYIYAVLFISASIYGTTVIADTGVNGIFSKTVAILSESTTEVESTASKSQKKEEKITTGSVLNSAMFMTIVQGADEEVVCPNDGSTLGKFFLCGTSDVRTISLSQTGGSYEWQQLDPNTCAPTVIDDCPTINASCTWNTVGTAPTFNLSVAGEFRVRVDSGQYFYFKATSNPLDPQLIHEDIICGNPGRVEVTNVPAGYEYSLNSPGGPYQDDPFFDITAPGDYRVFARLKNVSSSACVFPSNSVTVQDLN